MSKTILVVDDESKMLEMIGNYLQKEGFGVMTAAAGREALRKAKEEQPDLIVLDWMMPDIAGIEVLAELRKFSQAPVIMLTAKTEEVDKLLGLEMGADDYITKPFSLRELSARIRAQLRRAGVLSAAASDTVRVGSLILGLSEHQASIGGQLVSNLTPTEFKLLSFLAQHPGRVFTRLQLLEHALGEAYEGYERSLDTHISNLRKKLEAVSHDTPYIKTVHGVGYKLEAGKTP